MRDILMIVHTMGTLLPSDNDRFTYIAKRVLEKDPAAQIEIVTSDFEHHKKRYRNENIKEEHPFKITFLHENAYQKNVSLARINGHLSFGKRLGKYLKDRKKPDVIYCAVPPLYSANVVADYANKNGIKLIIDVQDLWPESFQMVLGNSVFSKVLLSPLMVLANRVYSKADSIFAVSSTFAERASKYASKAGKSVYLGTDSIVVNNATKIETPHKPKEEFWIGYIGNIGVSYDFENLLIALNKVKRLGKTNIVFHIMGDGNTREKVERLAAEYFPETVIHGYLGYDKMLSYLMKCDIVVNPIIKNSVSSVVNKVGDYAAAGIATVNTQDSKEYRDLIDDYCAGINTKPEDSDSIADAICKLYDDCELRRKMGENNRRMYEALFDRRNTYIPIIEEILKKE